MKQLITFLFAFLVFGLCSPIAYGHGGVEKRAGDIVTTLFQTPLSPFVGEKVNFTFILTDATTNSRLVKKTANLIVTQAFLGNENKDKIILTKQVTSDVNGVINFSYTFPTTNYYDIDLAFGKKGDEATTTGFLVQPRSSYASQTKLILTTLAISIAGNLGLLFLHVRRSKKR